MTPKEFREIQKKLDAQIDALSIQIMEAYQQAYEYMPPVNLRPAVWSDITVDALIWYPKREGQKWVFVTDNILISDDSGDMLILPTAGKPIGFYADGDLFDLHGAFVEAE